MTFQFWALLSLACAFLIGVWGVVDASLERLHRRRECARQERLKRQQWDAIVSGRRAS